MSFKVENVLNYGFAWFKDRESLKYILMNFTIQCIAGIITIVLAIMLLGSNVLLLFLGKELPTSSYLQLMIPDFISKLIMFFLILIPIIIISSLALFYVQALMMLFALRKKNIVPAQFTLYKFLRLIALTIIMPFVAMFYSFDKTVRLAQWLSLLGSIISLVAIIFLRSAALFILPILIIFLIIYIITVVYNCLSLFVCNPVFLHEDIGIIQSLRRSFELTRNNMLNILFAAIILSIVNYLVGAIPSAILSMLPETLPYTSPLLAFGIFSLLAVALAPLLAIFNAFYSVGVYTELLAAKK